MLYAEFTKMSQKERGGGMKTTINAAEIEKTTNLGAGVVRVDGKTVFVDGAVAGDITDIEITNERA